MKRIRKTVETLVQMNPHRVWGPPTHETFLAKATANLSKSFKRIPVRRSPYSLKMLFNLYQISVLNDIHDQMIAAKRGIFYLSDFVGRSSDMVLQMHD
jgi:hypothetical protein